jgi:Mg2+-importing ATPase
MSMERRSILYPKSASPRGRAAPRTHRPFFGSRPGRLLLTTTLAVAGLALLIPTLPGAALFEFTALPFAVLATMVAITLAYVAASEACKRALLRPV